MASVIRKLANVEVEVSVPGATSTKTYFDAIRAQEVNGEIFLECDILGLYWKWDAPIGDFNDLTTLLDPAAENRWVAQ